MSAKHSWLGSRTVALAERRGSLVRLLIALFAARIAVTITEIVESELTFWSVLITAAIGIEAWRGWRVSRAPHAVGATVTLPDTVWNRMLLPLEHRGPPVLFALTAIYLVAYAVLLIADESADTILIVAQASREVITVVFVGVLVAGYMSVRPTFQADPPAG
jgi:hypothetical protein